jgi:hypothetical protein
VISSWQSFWIEICLKGSVYLNLWCRPTAKEPVLRWRNSASGSRIGGATSASAVAIVIIVITVIMIVVIIVIVTSPGAFEKAVAVIVTGQNERQCLCRVFEESGKGLRVRVGGGLQSTPGWQADSGGQRAGSGKKYEDLSHGRASFLSASVIVQTRPDGFLTAKRFLLQLAVRKQNATLRRLGAVNALLSRGNLVGRRSSECEMFVAHLPRRLA